jgi:hypothetical protein
MSLLKYFPMLPNAQVSLCTRLLSRAIKTANDLVEKEMTHTKKRSKSSLHGICRYSPEFRAEIGQYACENGIKRANSHFSRKMKECQRTYCSIYQKDLCRGAKGKEKV